MPEPTTTTTTDTAPSAPPLRGRSAPAPSPALSAQDLQQLGGLVASLAMDPATRPKLLEIVKTRWPEAPIPELDIPRDVERRVEERAKPVEDRLGSVERDLLALRAELTRQRWRDERGLTDEELAEIEKLAKDRRLPDAETAWELWQAQQRLGRPRSSPSPTAGLTKDDWKQIVKNPARWAQQGALADLEAMRRGRRF